MPFYIGGDGQDHPMTLGNEKNWDLFFFLNKSRQEPFFSLCPSKKAHCVLKVGDAHDCKSVTVLTLLQLLHRARLKEVPGFPPTRLPTARCLNPGGRCRNHSSTPLTFCSVLCTDISNQDRFCIRLQKTTSR